MRSAYFRQSRTSWLVAIGVSALAAACGEQVTAPRQVPQHSSGVIGLPEVVGTGCRYGGDYPFCYSAPPPGGGGMNGGGESPSAPTGGGGGSPTPPPDSTSECVPATDPHCEQPLTHSDSTTIQKAIRDYIRADSTIADTITRRKCKSMLTQFNTSFSAGNVFRGNSDTQNPDGTGHYGLTDNSHIHFDPWLLGGAASGNASDLRELANTALHEAAHVLGFNHPNGETNGVYTDSPFNLLPGGSGPCIK